MRKIRNIGKTRRNEPVMVWWKGQKARLVRCTIKEGNYRNNVEAEIKYLDGSEAVAPLKKLKFSGTNET
tara:strand:+ start:1382 stop:1588 length:207 start_codon:yes stop_codon:yes gene_type:complete